MSAKEELLARLDAICFHDVPVGKIAFEADSSNDFVVDFALHNEETSDYDCFTVRFIGVTELKTDALFLNAKSDFEITHFDYKWTDLFEGELVFLLGFSQPSFSVNIQCQQVELEATVDVK